MCAAQKLAQCREKRRGDAPVLQSRNSGNPPSAVIRCDILESEYQSNARLLLLLHPYLSREQNTQQGRNSVSRFKKRCWIMETLKFRARTSGCSDRLTRRLAADRGVSATVVRRLLLRARSQGPLRHLVVCLSFSQSPPKGRPSLCARERRVRWASYLIRRSCTNICNAIAVNSCAINYRPRRRHVFSAGARSFFFVALQA